MAGKVLTFLTNLLVAVALVAAASAVLFVFGGDTEANEAFIGGYKPLVVLSGSMEPQLRTNGIVIVRMVDYRSVETGDIVSVRRGEAFVTHRVTEVGHEGLTTKGDANDTADAVLVSPDEQIARVVHVVNSVAPVVRALRTGEGIFPFVVAPALAIACALAAVSLLVPSRAQVVVVADERTECC